MMSLTLDFLSLMTHTGFKKHERTGTHESQFLYTQVNFAFVRSDAL